MGRFKKERAEFLAQPYHFGGGWTSSELLIEEAFLWLNKFLKNLQKQTSREKWKYIKTSALENLSSKVKNEHPSTTQVFSSSRAFGVFMNSCLSLFFPQGSNIWLSRWCTGISKSLPSLEANVDLPLQGRPISANFL